MQTILLAQRVNTTFLATITNSKSLQRKLFLASQPNIAPTGTPSLNPLLGKVLGNLPLWFNSETKNMTRLAHQATTHHISLEQVEVCELHQAQDGDSSRARTPLYYVKGMMYSREDSTAVLGHGSWERMLLAQPPCAGLFTLDQFASRDISARNISARGVLVREISGRRESRDTHFHPIRTNRRVRDFSLHFSIAKNIGSVGELLKGFAAAEASHLFSSQQAELVIGQALVDGKTLRCDT
ncbi:hypothetical protein LTR81_014609 [Elasticomyces elasticus]